MISKEKKRRSINGYDYDSQSLKKEFKKASVLKGISFYIRQGEVLCILGPNGAGKSTTINILTAALRSDGGEILFKGTKIRKYYRVTNNLLELSPRIFRSFSPYACGGKG